MVRIAAALALLVATDARAAAAQPVQPIQPGQGSQSRLPFEPTRERGQGVTPAYEGWFRNADGTFTLLAGYYNRNLKETIEVPVGPNNRIEPGAVDQGQPTVFFPRRHWGVVAITVPADFGTKRFTWKLVANGHAAEIPLWLNPLYEISPFNDPATGNKPPVIRLDNGQTTTGPPRGIAATYQASVSKPLTLTVWITDVEGKERQGGTGPLASAVRAPLTLFLTKHRGPGEMVFDTDRPDIAKADGKATANVRFSTPGEYVVRVQANDSTGDGGGGFQCCWTNALVKVNVVP
jgi:hypothetical protein